MSKERSGNDTRTDDDNAAYRNLGPENILDAVDSVGFQCDGRLLALNSYENRVYQVGTEGGAPMVVKFYRPRRWSDEAILEEHRYTQGLAQLEIPVVAPWADPDGTTLHRHGLFRFALYPRCPGRAPELDNPAHLAQLGRFVGRIHSLGAARPFEHRITLGIERFAVDSSRHLLANGIIPVELEPAYRTLADDLIARARVCFERAGAVRYIRLHGDCHPGNILWHDGVPHIVDFDDACMGPAVQDLWLYLSGRRTYMTRCLAELLEGYTLFREFDPRELHLVEALRTLRMMHHAAWLARRWDDPAFPRAFPWFGTRNFWDEHVLALREQAALMDEEPLAWL